MGARLVTICWCCLRMRLTGKKSQIVVDRSTQQVLEIVQGFSQVDRVGLIQSGGWDSVPSPNEIGRLTFTAQNSHPAVTVASLSNHQRVSLSQKVHSFVRLFVRSVGTLGGRFLHIEKKLGHSQIQAQMPKQVQDSSKTARGCIMGGKDIV
jgi:hypothetical protein